MPDDTSTAEATPKKINLFDYTEEALLHEHALTHYEILNVPEYATQDDVKKAYRKASLKYHPDKTGRGDDDYVFLAVKAAHDALMDPAKRQAYDSTVMPFDDAIPPARAQLLQDPMLLYTDDDFYSTFGPVFERNLRFDARLRPENKAGKGLSGSGSSNNINGSNGSNHSRNGTKTKRSANATPVLGDANTPLEDVHRFYEYWIHFESWRDFSQVAAEELQMSGENAESRFEKRWIQNEVNKRAKQLKKQEMGRIQLLVERAMEADPRLRAERQQRLAAKEEAARQRELEEARRAQEDEARKRAEEERLEQEKIQKAEEKERREKEKKLVRKARQQLRRMTSASFENLASDDKSDNTEDTKSEELPWKDSYDLNVDIDLLCASLTLDELRAFNEQYEQHQKAIDALRLVQQKVSQVKLNGFCRSNSNVDEQKENETQSEEDDPQDEATTSNNKNVNNNKIAPLPWTKEELSALAKGVKKYPPGGANRWDQITLFVNNICRQDIPRNKEECIERYNFLARGGGAKNTGNNANNNSTASPAVVSDKEATTPTKDAARTSVTTASADPTTTTTSASAAGNENGEDDVWSPEQDQQLQDGLAKFPASMEKNERWTSIAKGVTGKTKKQCVQRFKVIREALKNRK